MKLYADIVDRKAHYSDAQFRTLIEIYALAMRTGGHLPTRRALSAREGKENIDFLFEEGDLEETAEGPCSVHGWGTYQAYDRTGAQRQSRYRNALRDRNGDGLSPFSSISISNEELNARARASTQNIIHESGGHYEAPSLACPRCSALIKAKA